MVSNVSADSAVTFTDADVELVARIHATYEALLAAPGRDQQQDLAHRLGELVGQRSPGRVRQMEIAQGLRHAARGEA